LLRDARGGKTDPRVTLTPGVDAIGEGASASEASALDRIWWLLLILLRPHCPETSTSASTSREQSPRARPPPSPMRSTPDTVYAC